MPIRSNPLKSALASGRTLVGTRLCLLRYPAALVLLKRIGLDFVLLDMRQPPVSTEAMAAMAVVARAIELPLIVELPIANREWIMRSLDAGVWGVHAMGIRSCEEAHAVVDAARHAPVGNRGTFEPGPQNDYVEPPEPGELAHLNAQVHVSVGLARAASERDFDQIVALDGIDAFALDAGARSSGTVPDRLAAAARCGRHTMTDAASFDALEALVRSGVSMIAYRSDTAILRDGFAANVAWCREVASGTATAKSGRA